MPLPEIAFVLVKPTAIALGGIAATIRAIERVGLVVTQGAFITSLPDAVARELYAEHRTSSYFERLVASLSGDAGTYAMVVAGPQSVDVLARLLQPGDPRHLVKGQKARAVQPDALVYVSESTAEAIRDSRLILGSLAPRLMDYPLSDWRHETGGTIEACQTYDARKGRLVVERSETGITLTAHPAMEGERHSIGVEFDRGSLLLTIARGDFDEPVASLRVDHTGASLASEGDQQPGARAASGEGQERPRR